MKRNLRPEGQDFSKPCWDEVNKWVISVEACKTVRGAWGNPLLNHYNSFSSISLEETTHASGPENE